jgi:hypothetical protein
MEIGFSAMDLIEPIAKQFMQKTRYDARYNMSYVVSGSRTIEFHDNRFPHMSKVGAIFHDGEKFIVESTLIKNSKYVTWKRQHNYKECKKADRALKNLVDFVRPLSLSQVGKEAMGYAEDKESTWRSRATAAANDVIRNRLTVSKIVEEIKHLVSMGVEFKTDEFRNIVKEGLALYDEQQRIAAVKTAHNYVYFMPDGRKMLGAGMNNTKEFMSEEDLPEEISNNIALLKMLGDKEFIPEIGYKRSDREYVVFTPIVDSTPN